MKNSIKIGSRGSKLALWQAHHIAELLKHKAGIESEVIVIETKGDRIIDVPLPKIGGKGLFTEELERSLMLGTIDVAVHSLKDLPTENIGDFVVAAVVARGPAGDALICKGNKTLLTLSNNARVGTSSTRRAAQLLRARPDLTVIDIRGNVETRINKVLKTVGYDATVLAHAGLQRLGFSNMISEIFPEETMLSAPAQGAIGVQCVTDSWCRGILSTINDAPTMISTLAERTFLGELNGGCSKPVAAYAKFIGEKMVLTGRVLSLDGRECITVYDEVLAADAVKEAIWLGKKVAAKAVGAGALRLLNEATN